MSTLTLATLTHWGTQQAAADVVVRGGKPVKVKRDNAGRFADKAGVDKFGEQLGDALVGQKALDAVPAKLKRAPEGHSGNYAGEQLSGPPGMGSVRALSEYEGVEYSRINGVLRGQFEYKAMPWDTPEQIADRTANLERIRAEIGLKVDEIDKTMAVSKLAEDVRVDRVIRYGAQVFGDEAWYGDMNLKAVEDFDEQDRLYERWTAGERPDLTGLRWSDGGFVSTTADPAVAPEFGKRWPGFNSPGEGEPVIMTILVPKGTGGVQLAEMGHAAEILLDRGLTMEVAADHGIDSQGFRRLDVRVVDANG